MLKYLPVIIFLGFACLSCNIKNPKEPTPTYIHIDSFSMVDNPKVIPPKLSLSSQITAVYAYYNNNPIGYFDLPVTFPIITNGRGQLKIFPAVAVDGLNNFMATYPFYTSDTLTFDPQPGAIVKMSPKTRYHDSTKHYLNYSFSSSGTISFTLLNGTVPVTTTTDPANVFEGTGSGMISLHLPLDTLSESKSFDPFNVPVGVDAYIELNYKSTVPFYLGLRANLNGSTTFYQRYLSGVNPSDKWQKFYLAIKDFAAQYKGDYYDLYIKASLPAGVTSGTVLIDNVQFVYF